MCKECQSQVVTEQSGLRTCHRCGHEERIGKDGRPRKGLERVPK